MEGKAKRGRPKNTWEQTIKKDLEKLSQRVSCAGIGGSALSGYQDPFLLNEGKGLENDKLNTFTNYVNQDNFLLQGQREGVAWML